MIESGRRRLTLEEFLALPGILRNAGLGRVELPDLVGTAGHALLSPLSVVSSQALHDVLAGRPAASTTPQAPAGKAPAVGIHDRAIQEAETLWRRWAKGRFVHPRDPNPAVLFAVAVESRNDTVVNAARVLRCSPVAVSLAAVLVWEGHLFISERDGRVRQRVGEGAGDSRRVQAIRGHVTRVLLAELRPTLQNMTGRKTRGAQ